MQTPSIFGSDVGTQVLLHEGGNELNCWRSHVRPLPLALLYYFFGRFSQACLETATIFERDKLFVLELCAKVGCRCRVESKGPVVFPLSALCCPSQT